MPWIKCSDKMPENLSLVLVHEDGAIRCMLWEHGSWESTSIAKNMWGDTVPGVRVRDTGVYQPTHWMPLPDPPVSESVPVANS